MGTGGSDMRTTNGGSAALRETQGGEWAEHAVKWYKVLCLYHIFGLGNGCAPDQVAVATRKLKFKRRLPKCTEPSNHNFKPNVVGLLT
eukprot:9488300-Pyramimonas_sp.AAC.1